MPPIASRATIYLRDIFLKRASRDSPFWNAAQVASSHLISFAKAGSNRQDAKRWFIQTHHRPIQPSEAKKKRSPCEQCWKNKTGSNNIVPKLSDSATNQGEEFALYFALALSGTNLLSG
mmetsp:Transcript_35825/g.59730  ORF Transcript_35825/g.59730 Transcript_35825/m.59730 type:complete len:119 (-) Transcript_35825:2784-3140(-)